MDSRNFFKLISSEQEKKKYNNEKLKFFILSFFGLNTSNYNCIIKNFGLSSNIKIKDLSFNLLKEILIFIETHFILNEEKRKQIQFYKSFFIKNKHWKGVRYLKGYPVRGQRTHSNAKTARRFVFKF